MALGQPSTINAGSNSIDFYDDVKDEGNVTGTMEHGNSGLTQIIRVAWEDQVQAISDILGTNTVGNGGLIREPPLQHALYPAFYATRVTLAGGYRADGKYTAGVGNDVAEYDWMILVINYTTLPYNVEFAAGQTCEYFRYVSRLPQPGVEFLKIGQAGTQYQYVSSVLPPDGPSGLTVPFGQTKRIPKTTLAWVWYQVPYSWLFNSDGVPTNIANGVGCVNNAVFPPGATGQYMPGTLLMNPPQIEAISSPAAELANGTTPNLEYNVKFLVSFYDPPLNTSDTTLKYGHNCAPWTDGNFYYTQTVPTPTTSGQPIYPSYDFTQFFAQAQNVGDF